MLATQVVAQLISLAILAVMLRLVRREEYGLVGMALPAVMLPRMAAMLGLQATVLQRDLTHEELSSLFWHNLVWGLAAAAATAAGGWWLAGMYRQPLLAPLCLALAGSTLLVALANQHQALLERKLKLGPLSGARLLALVCGGFAGIYTARRGAGAWALVSQQYGELAVLAIWVWLLEPWRPGWPRRETQVGGLLRFSGYYSLSQLVNYVAQNLDKLLLPAVFGPTAAAAVGLYSQAFNLMIKPVYLLTSPLTGVMLSGLSQAQGDKEAHTAVAARFFRLVGIGLFPCAAGLFVVGPDVMTVLGSARWREAGLILSALAPALLVQGLFSVSSHVLSSAGKSGRLLMLTLVMCLLVALGGWAGIHFGELYLARTTNDRAFAGALGLAIGYSTVMLALWGLPFVSLCLRMVGIRPAAVLLPLVPALVAAVAMGLAVWGISLLPPVRALRVELRLATLVAAGVIVYAALTFRELRWIWHELAAPQPRLPTPDPHPPTP